MCNSCHRFTLTEYDRKSRTYFEKELVGVFVNRAELIQKTVLEMDENEDLEELVKEARSNDSNTIVLNLHFKDGWDSCGELLYFKSIFYMITAIVIN